MHVADFVARYVQLMGILRRLRPDVVLAGPIQTSAFLVALTGWRRLVTMSWGSDLLVHAHRNSRMHAITRWTLRRSAAGFGDCQAVRDAFARFGVRPERIVTFPWGIDPKAFARGQASPVRARLGWLENPVLICTRSWEPGYDVDLLVKAFSLVHKQRPDARLILVGDGPHKPTIDELIDGFALNEVIHRPGRVPNKDQASYYHAADIYLSPVPSDGTSISLLEAMASELPVVVTSCEGNKEWVEHGVNGWLVSPGDLQGFAASMTSAIDAPAGDLRKMGEANAQIIHSRACWAENVPALLELLRRVSHDKKQAQRENASA